MKFIIITTLLLFAQNLYANQSLAFSGELAKITSYQAVPELISRSLVNKKIHAIKKRNSRNNRKLSSQRLNALVSDIEYNAVKTSIGYFSNEFSQNTDFQKKALEESLKYFSLDELRYIVNKAESIKSNHYSSRKNAELFMSDPVLVKYNASRKEIATGVIKNNKDYINSLFPDASNLIDKMLSESFASLYGVESTVKPGFENHHNKKSKKSDKSKKSKKSDKSKKSKKSDKPKKSKKSDK